MEIVKDGKKKITDDDGKKETKKEIKIITIQPVDGGSTREHIHINPKKNYVYFYWTQTVDDVTIHVTLPASVKASYIKCDINEKSIKLLLQGMELINNTFPYKVNKHDSVWSITRNDEGTILLIHIPKPMQLKGFWAKLFEDDNEEIDLTKLGLAPGETEKDRKQKPVKVDDPKALAKIAKAHPELGIKLGINNDESDNSTIDKQSESKASFKGKSSFTW